MTPKRFRLDTGSFIDMQENKVLTDRQATNLLNELAEENKALRKQLESEHTMLDNAILLERTRMGQNSLKQYKEAIQ